MQQEALSLNFPSKLMNIDVPPSKWYDIEVCVFSDASY